ncbi:MAG TPA: glycosyltransferase family 39 protein [Patescibacteria group bacterium]
MAKKIPSTIAVSIIVVALLLLTFAVRVYHLDWIQFDSDFGRDSLFGWRILTEKFTLLGAQASVGGFYLGPFYFYFVAALYALFGPVPEIVMLAFAILNVLAAWLGFKLLSSRVNLTAGLLFLLLFSTQPLMVVSSRAATHTPMLPFITLLALTLLLRSVTKPSLLTHLLAGCALGLFLHVHFSALLLFPGYFLVVAGLTLGKWRQKLAALMLHGLGVILMLSPLILFDFRHEFITSRAFFEYGAEVVKGESVRDSFLHWTLGEKIDNILLYVGPLKWLQLVIVLASGLGLFSLIRMVPSQAKTLALTLSFLTGSVVVLLLLYPGYLFLYYLVVPGTLLLLTVAVLLSYLQPKWLGILIALLVSVLQLRSLVGLYKPEFRNLRHLTSITAAIETDVKAHGNKPFAIYKDSSDGLTTLGYEYRFLLTRDGLRPVSEYDYSLAEVVYVIREEGTTDPLTLGGHEMSQFQPQEMRLVQTLFFNRKQVDIFALTR